MSLFPDDSPRRRTTWVYADRNRRAVPCRDCGKAIEFAANATTQKVMPFNAPILALTTKHDGNGRLLEEVELATSHFVDCRAAAKFRRPR